MEAKENSVIQIIEDEFILINNNIKEKGFSKYEELIPEVTKKSIEFAKQISDELCIEKEVINNAVNAKLIPKIIDYIHSKIDEELKTQYIINMKANNTMNKMLEKEIEDENTIFTDENTILKIQEVFSKAPKEYGAEKIVNSFLIEYTNNIEKADSLILKYVDYIEDSIESITLSIAKQNGELLEKLFDKNNYLLYQQIVKIKENSKEKALDKFVKIAKDIDLNSDNIKIVSLSSNLNELNMQIDGISYVIKITNDGYLINKKNNDNEEYDIFYSDDLSLVNDYSTGIEYFFDKNNNIDMCNLLTKKSINKKFDISYITDRDIKLFLKNKYGVKTNNNLIRTKEDVASENLFLENLIEQMMIIFKLDYISAIDTINSSMYSHLMSNPESEIWKLNPSVMVENIEKDVKEKKFPVPFKNYYAINGIDISAKVNDEMKKVLAKISNDEVCNLLDAFNMYKTSESYDTLISNNFYTAQGLFYEKWKNEQVLKNSNNKIKVLEIK